MSANNIEAITYTDNQVREARDKLWRRGILYWKLDTCQRGIYDFYHSKGKEDITINASRRLGKSYLLLIICLEQCLKYPGSVIKYVQPTRDMIRTNLNPDFEQMLEDCPLDLRPEFKSQGNVWEFPNGSRINVAGTDGKNYNKLRGGQCSIFIIDEAGFCSDLSHIINYIITPMMLRTKGRTILASTTPTDPDHEFVAKMDFAESQGTLIRKTIYDSVEEQKNDLHPTLTMETIGDILKKYNNNPDSPEFRTEYMCKIALNNDDAVLPEWTEDVQQYCIKNYPRPIHFDRYVAMDIGFVDLTVVLFAYWNYDKGCLVIEDEYVQQRGTTKVLAAGIKKKEQELWTNPVTGELEKPFLRVSDNNLRVIEDLSLDHALHFLPTEKHDKLTYISSLRTMIEQQQIFINPRCKTLISHMKASWTKDRKDFKRSPDGGHYDGAAALLYLSRNIDKTRNPYPNGYRYNQLGASHNVFVKNEDTSGTSEFLLKLNQALMPKSSFSRNSRLKKN